MLRKLCVLALVVTPLAFIGCGGVKEVPPTTVESEMDKKVEMDKAAESMEKSLEHIPPEQQEMYKKQMEQMKKGGGQPDGE